MPDPRQTFQLTVTDAKQGAPQLLADASGLSIGQIKQAMQKGAVWLTRDTHTQRLRRAKRALKIGDELTLNYAPDILSQTVDTPLLIDDAGQYSVWYKPYGVYSSGSKWADHCAIDRLVDAHFGHERACFVVHRLDRATTGLMVIAHSKHAAREFSLLFEQHKIQKCYLAVVHGDGKAYTETQDVDLELDGKACLSGVTCLASTVSGEQSLMHVELKTGRKHQIRRHLSALALPIVGDRLFGRGESDRKDLQLQANTLAFTCPLTGEVKNYQVPGDYHLSL